MSRYDLFNEIEKINNKDISEEEKKKQIKKAYSESEEREQARIKKQDKNAITFFIVFLLLLAIISLFAILEIEIDSEAFFAYGIFIVGFVYCLFYKIKITKQEKIHKDVIKKEVSQFQELYKNLINNFYVEKTEENYKELYKREVVSKYVKSVEEGLQYDEEEIKEEEVKQEYYYAGFDIQWHPTWTLETEDRIYGNISKDVYIEMFDVVSYTRRSVKDGGGHQILFNGSFVILNLDKLSLEASIRLKKVDYCDKNNLVISNNVLFDKYFKIYAKYKEKAESYLKQDVIKFIADFREKYQIDFEIIFKEKIYIRFYTDNMFKPQMKGKIQDEHSVYQFYVITKFVKELVEKLNIM